MRKTGQLARYASEGWAAAGFPSGVGDLGGGVFVSLRKAMGGGTSGNA